jgi:hypothetical protein
MLLLRDCLQNGDRNDHFPDGIMQSRSLQPENT